VGTKSGQLAVLDLNTNNILRQMNDHTGAPITSLDSVYDDTKKTESVGDGPVDAIFKAIKKIYPHNVNLQLYQVQAVTEGTDAQATVSVRIEENGKISVGQAADTDTLVASAKAYINALNKLIIKRKRTAPSSDLSASA
jgi:2-isopropylmalate synthase